MGAQVMTFDPLEVLPPPPPPGWLGPWPCPTCRGVSGFLGDSIFKFPALSRGRKSWSRGRPSLLGSRRQAGRRWRRCPVLSAAGRPGLARVTGLLTGDEGRLLLLRIPGGHQWFSISY